MIKTIFRNTFLIGISILALCAVLFFGIQYTQIKNDTYGALKQEAAYAEQGLLIGGEDYLKTLGDENRVTWIDADGNVGLHLTAPAAKHLVQRFPERLGIEIIKGKIDRRLG